MIRTLPWALVACVAFTPRPAAGGDELVSMWASEPATIDGDVSEWSGTLVPVDDGRLEVGARNDSDMLYLCVRILHPNDQTQSLMAGLSTWLDPDDAPKLGIRYPVRSPPAERKARGRDRERARDGSADGPADRAARLRDRAIASPSDIEILEADGDVRTRRPGARLPGVALALGEDGDVLVYELRVPLGVTPETPYALDAADGQVDLEFVAKKVDRRSGRGTGGPRGGAGGRPGGGRGSRGGGPGASGERGPRPEPPPEHPFSIDASLRLATAP